MCDRRAAGAWRWCLAAALLLMLSGCMGSKQPAPPPGPPPGQNQPPPGNSDPTPAPEPDRTIPTTLGITQVGVGPGLIVDGYTTEAQIRVEMRNGNTVVHAIDATPKDDGRWSVVWPAPKSAGNYIQVMTKDGKVLVGGTVGMELNVGLYYAEGFSGVHVDVAGQELKLGGTTNLPGARFAVELRQADTVLATHKVEASQTGAFTATIPWAEGAHTVWFYAVDGQGRPVRLALIVPIVTHGEG